MYAPPENFEIWKLRNIISSLLGINFFASECAWPPFLKKRRDCVGLELDISTLKGWAQVIVAYQDAYIFENMAVVTY